MSFFPFFFCFFLHAKNVLYCKVSDNSDERIIQFRKSELHNADERIIQFRKSELYNADERYYSLHKVIVIAIVILLLSITRHFSIGKPL